MLNLSSLLYNDQSTSLFSFFFFFFGISGRLLLCFWRRNRVKVEQAQLRSRGFARSLRVAVHHQEDLPRSQESRQPRRLPFLPLFFPFFFLFFCYTQMTENYNRSVNAEYQSLTKPDMTEIDPGQDFRVLRYPDI